MKVMRKIGKTLLLILAGFLALLAILALFNYVMTRLEKASISPPGKMVDAGHGKMHVYTEGSGRKNVVLLSGWGNPCPVADFQPLIKALRNEYTVTVVDYFGYGWSGQTRSLRTNANIVEETRAALKAAGIRPPYILLPHSLSGIYALYYSRKYPGEVAGIVNLDTSFPELNNYSQDASTSPLYRIARLSGILRLLVGVNPAIIGYPAEYFSGREIALMGKMACRNMHDSTMLAESGSIYANRAELIGCGYPRDIPVVMILADSSSAESAKYFNGMDWVAMHKAQVADNVNGSVYVMHGGHNIYWNNAGKIAAIVGDAMGK